MAMLTREEVRQVFEEIFESNPDEFERKVADYMPQNIITELGQELVRFNMNDGEDLDTAARSAANTLMGFHMGWELAVRSHAS